MKSFKNKSLLITKNRQEAEKSLMGLIDAGMEIIYFPTIKIIPILDSPALNETLSIFDEFDTLIFTSANAVDIFNNIAEERQIELSKVKIAAIGKSTEEKCKYYEINVDILPDEFSAKGLIEKLSKTDLIDKKVLIPGSSLSRNDLEKSLEKLGAQVTCTPIYDVILNDKDNLHDEIKKVGRKHLDIFAFTSPSSFENFIEIMNVNDVNEYFDKSTICAIGTTTEEAIRKQGLTVNIVPQVFSLQGIADAIKKYFLITANMV